MIKLKGIEKDYKMGDIILKALDRVSINIDKGEFVSIIGSSGSGKSTLMNILGCLDVPTKGDYYLDNEDVSKLNDNQLAIIRNKKIGFVFQSFNLLAKLNALENVELPMVYGGVHLKTRIKKAKEALEKVGLTDRMHHKPNELSGGQRQRVAIARAIVNNPKIILADEPTGNLDSKSEIEIMEIFKKLNNEGATIIMVTHEQEIAKNSKRIITVKDGLVIGDNKI
ncbi:ABC transporter ATP-binding protein [Haliovirga abyssi]|uniref:Macrolide ABC transporter ATP-binding protein n=1 Tax=Haliovirga abyssi TaxID=2996794 RepID=A0AAU9DHE4_9FUSO|nr:ABC transporter ATP-binding protein [Haliovirga abyssi]BDU50947.1 macrolide ABC transporter ATP-binding protein [Haliovirga abyssi]